VTRIIRPDHSSRMDVFDEWRSTRPESSRSRGSSRRPARPEPGAPLNVPLIPASNFIIGDGRAYPRNDGTPSWEALEEVVGGLESGSAVAFASGMASIAAMFDQLLAGAVVVLRHDCYQGVAGLVAAGGEKSLVRGAPGRAGYDRLDSRLRRREPDLAGVALEPTAHGSGPGGVCAAPRKPGVILAVDNTFATPLNQQPLELGATVSLQSATKFMGGPPTC
jgi:cystathionine gamma-synthase